MSSSKNRDFLGYLILGLLIMMVLSPDLFASSTGGGSSNLPWETPLTQIKNSLSGPVAGAISLIGVIAAGSMLLFGNSGDFSGAFRALIWVVLIIALIISANSIIAMFTGSGAVI